MLGTGSAHHPPRVAWQRAEEEEEKEDEEEADDDDDDDDDEQREEDEDEDEEEEEEEEGEEDKQLHQCWGTVRGMAQNNDEVGCRTSITTAGISGHWMLSILRKIFFVKSRSSLEQPLPNHRYSCFGDSSTKPGTRTAACAGSGGCRQGGGKGGGSGA